MQMNLTLLTHLKYTPGLLPSHSILGPPLRHLASQPQPSTIEGHEAERGKRFFSTMKFIIQIKVVNELDGGGDSKRPRIFSGAWCST